MDPLDEPDSIDSGFSCWSQGSNSSMDSNMSGRSDDSTDSGYRW